MKKKLLFTAILLVLTTLCLLTACDIGLEYADVKVKNISVDGIEYHTCFVGDTLDLTTAKLVVVYENGDMEEIPLTADMIDSSFDTNTPGLKQVKVNFKNASTTFEVEVLDLDVASISLVVAPEAKKEYIEGTDFDTTGLSVNVEFVGGRIVPMSVLSNMIIYDNSVIGPQLVRIIYRSQELTYPITVVKKKLVSVAVSKVPTARTVFIGKSVNPSGMELTLTYDNRQKETKTYAELSAMCEIGFLGTQVVQDQPTQVLNPTYAEASPSKAVTVWLTMDGAKHSCSFNIQVISKQWKSMRITQEPVTKGVKDDPTKSTDLQNIIQGDTIDWSTGVLEITFDDDSIEYLPMNSSFIKVYNDTAKEMAQITGLTMSPVDVTDVPAGDYVLSFGESINDSQYPYENRPTYTVTVKDVNGEAVRVSQEGDSRIVEVQGGMVYIATMTASVVATQEIDGEEREVTLYTTSSYQISTVGAETARRSLDISSAGEYTLIVIYKEDEDWSIKMNAKVLGRSPVSLELANTDDIDKKTYVVGEKVNISFTKYRLIYNNGDADEWASVTQRMLSPECSLDCNVPSSQEEKRISFTVLGIVSATLVVKIDPILIVRSEFEEPTDTYVTLGDSQGINLEGGTLKAYLNNDTAELYTLAELVQKGATVVYPDSAGAYGTTVSGEYVAHFIYGDTVNYEIPYHVVLDVVKVLALEINVETMQLTYYQHEELNFDGLKLNVTYNSGATEQVDVDKDMLYHYTLGDSQIYVRYKGKVVSYTLEIIPKYAIAASLSATPRTVYVDGVHTQLDLGGIKLLMTYNDGSTEEKIGILLSQDGQEGTWTSNASTLHFSTTAGGEARAQTVVLTYHDVYNPELIEVTYDILIVERTIKAITLYDPLTASSGDTKITDVSVGFPLNLQDKYIYVEYNRGVGDGPTQRIVDKVRLTVDMVNYSENDRTTGKRDVKITYNEAHLDAYVQVRNTYLAEVDVAVYPKLKYMIGEGLDLAEGMVRRIFKGKNSSADDFTDMVPMAMPAGKTQKDVGFDSNYEESVFGNSAFLTQTLTLSVYDYSWDYNSNKNKTIPYTMDISIYKQFLATISYYSTVSFYGDVSAPSISVFQDVEEFTVPTASIDFISTEDLIETLPLGAEEIVEYNDDGSVKLRYYRVLLGSGSYDIYYKLTVEKTVMTSRVAYVKASDVTPYSQYPTTPKPSPNKYLILVTVTGNKYYKPSYYATKEFNVVERYAMINVVDPDAAATVWTIKVAEGQINRAVYLASVAVDRLKNISGMNIILATPTTTGFEVVLRAYPSTYTPEAIIKTVCDYVQLPWYSFYEAVIKDGNETYNEDGSIRTRLVERQMASSPSPVFEYTDPQKLQVSIVSCVARTGVNYKIFGETNEIYSFYCEDLLAVRRGRFFEIEVFSGSLLRDVVKQDVNYITGNSVSNGYYLTDESFNLGQTAVYGYDILMTNPATSENALVNSNYYLSFSSKQYMIAQKEVVGLRFVGSNATLDTENDCYRMQVFYMGDPVTVTAQCKTEEEGAWSNIASDQLRCYKKVGDDWVPMFDENEGTGRGEFPNAPGEYKIQVCYNYVAKNVTYITSDDVVRELLLTVEERN